jgi:cellobiose phosphorylase
MTYKFIDERGTFVVKYPHYYNIYFPLTNKEGTLLSSISPTLGGDIKKDNEHFLTLPATIEDLRSTSLCHRDFFIKLESGKNEIIRLSRPYLDHLEAGFLYHKIIKNTSSFVIEILNFIPYNLDVEVMKVKIKNKTKREIKFTPTSFIPLYGRGEKNLRDHRHVSSLLNRLYLTKYGIFLKPTMVFDEKGHRKNTSIYFVLGYEEKTIPPQGQFPTLDYFYGKGDLTTPEAIEHNLKPANKKIPQFDGKEACASFRFKKKTLKEGGEVNYFLIMGIDEEKQKIEKTFRKLNSPQKIDFHLKETKKYWLSKLSQTEFNFNNKNFNNWLLWVKIQPFLRKLFGCSFLPHFDYGKGGRGWRDLWQDNLALLLNSEKQTGEQIYNNFKGVRVDGSNATIVTREGKFISDRNLISRVWMDHGIWPYLTLKLYINKTSDLEILLKKTTYFRDHQLKRAKEIDISFSQNDYLLRTKVNQIYKGTVLEHILIQNLVPFFNVGKHNIIRLENADWNDGLDMAPQKGESVTFSFMYAYNIKDMCSLLEQLKKRVKSISILKELSLLLDRINKPINYSDYKEKQERLEDFLEKVKCISGEKVTVSIDNLIYDLKEKSHHLFGWLKKKEWLKEGFFNGYYDEKGQRVEGRFKGKIRIMLASQVFPVMSEGADEQQIKKIWRTIKRYLYDKKRGGFRLNTDFGILYSDLGRTFGFSYGDKENGAFFNHMAIMLANALYKRNFIKEGSEVINSIYKMATAKEADIYPMIPEYFNSQGKGLYLYLTGSASWYIYTLLEEILGIKFYLGDILIEPKLLPDDFFTSLIEVAFNYMDKKIKVNFIKEGQRNKPLKINKLFLEDNEILPQNNKYLIKRKHIKRLKKERIIIKVYLS